MKMLESKDEHRDLRLYQDEDDDDDLNPWKNLI